MKIIIAGDGKVGMTLARQLTAEGYDLTLIDSNSRVLESSLEQFDVMTIQGNCATIPVLERAAVRSAQLLIAATSADEINLLCCTTAHSLNPKLHTIARIRNPEYNDQVFGMRDVFALSLAVNPEKQAALEIERLLKYPGFLKRETFAKGQVEIVELRVDEHSKLRDAALSGLNDIVGCKVLVCSVLRDGTAITPRGDFVLHVGDRVFVTASTNVLTTLLKNLGILTRKVSSIMIAGGGRVSYYLALRLQKSGMNVKLVEQNKARCEELAALLPSTRIICGDASNMALLEREGLRECDALVTATGLDELNMVISLFGKRCGVSQVITKLSRAESIELLDSLPLGSIVCPRELCCNTIVRYVRAMRKQTGAAITVHTIADGKAEAIEFLADETTLHCGVPLKQLRLRKNVLVAHIIRGVTSVIPDGDASYQPGDILVIVTGEGTVLNQLNDIFA